MIANDTSCYRSAKNDGKEESRLQPLGFYGVLNAISHKTELDNKEEELTGGGIHEVRFRTGKRKRMVSLIY